MKGLTEFLYAFIPGGLERSNGVIYLKLVEEFERSAVDTAWVVSLSSTARLLLGEYRIFFIYLFHSLLLVLLNIYLPFFFHCDCDSNVYLYAARGLCSSTSRKIEA